MFKKRLKGLIAMVLAGSIALTSLPLTASATISGLTYISNGSEVGLSTADLDDIIAGNPSQADIASHLTANNLWAISDWNTKYVDFVTGDELQAKLSEMKDSATEYSDAYFEYSHKVYVVESDPSQTTIDCDSSEYVMVDDFSNTAQTDIRTIEENKGIITSPLKEAKGWAAWYGVAECGDLYPEDANRYGNSDFTADDKLTLEYIKTAYETTCTDGFRFTLARENYSNTVFVVQIKSDYKTFKIPVYDGLGQSTGEVVPVTYGDTEALIPEDETNALKGVYKLVYEKDTENNSTSGWIENKADLWSAIEDVAGEYSEFDVSKAKLVRDVTYSIGESSKEGANYQGYFSSLDLLNNNSTDVMQYLNSHSASGDNIWDVETSHDYTAYTDDVNADITYILTNTDADTIYLTNMKNIAVTAETPVVNTKIDEDKVYDYPVSEYPASTDSLAAYLTTKVSPTAGYKYDTDNWTLWDFAAESGVAIKNNIPVSDNSKIGIDDYNNILYTYAAGLLVYFPKVVIAPEITVYAPEIGKTTGAITTTYPSNDGYSVTNISWYDGDTKLNASDAFGYEKQYTVKVTLKPDAGLAFVESTPVTINGEAPAAKTLNQDGTLTVSFTFDEITLTAIPSAEITVTAPELGKAPSTNATLPANANYTVSDVSWSTDDAQFKSGVKYTVSAKLTPDSGYKFTAATVAKINGKNATATLNNDGSLTVSFTFDEIALTAITSAEIAVTAPARYKTPSTEATLPAGANYTVSEVSWSPNDAQFKSGVKYTVSAKLTPNDGYKFTANTAVKINNYNATVVLNNDGTLTVSYTFGRLGGGSSGGSGSSSSRNDDSTTSAKTAKSVGWANIINEIKSAVPGSTITITMNSETVIPEDALKAAIANKVKLVLGAGAGSKWVIDGANANSARYTDFTVYTDNVGIPAAAYNSISCSANKQFMVKVDTLNYTVQLYAFVNYAQIGKKAVVYFYNEKTGKLMYQKSAVVDNDGCVPVDVACSGSFFIALGNEISDSGLLLCGDSNGDGVINALDASEILKNVVSGNPVDNRNADANADGIVSALDAMYILQYVVGIITKFPANT